MKLVILAPIIAVLALITPTLAFAHTADYSNGYNVGKQDSRGGAYEPGDACDVAGVQNIDHCIAGYHDGFYGANSGSSSSGSGRSSASGPNFGFGGSNVSPNQPGPSSPNSSNNLNQQRHDVVCPPTGKGLQECLDNYFLYLRNNPGSSASSSVTIGSGTSSGSTGSSSTSGSSQCVPGCPNDTVSQHPPAYWAGYYQGVLDREHGTPKAPSDASQNSNLTGTDLQQYTGGYEIGVTPPAP